MKKLKKLVVGNWKVNPPSLEEARSIANRVKRGSLNVRRTQVAICPPFVYLGSLSSFPNNKQFFLGAQDAFYEPVGPFTGEVSFIQLPDFKTSFVILGHSERRAMGESDTIVNKKVRVVVGEGMTAILCVGEKARDHSGEYLGLVRKQIIEGLRDITKKALDRVVIAYEPVWAVGAREAMNPTEIHEMSIFIKKVLREIYGMPADSVRILYGGDVTVGNVLEIVRDGNVAGVLVGRESLNPKDFVEIIKTVDSI